MSSKLKAENLSSHLINSFFINYPSDFQIIYDKFGFLKPFFETEKANHANFNVLLINSTRSPSEFILRDRIVADYDETTGWYGHNWIIYVYGQYTEEIEAFESFLYYSRIGKQYKFDSLVDLLFYLPNSLISSKKGTFIIESTPELNKIVLPLLLNTPITCFISKTGELSEAAVWMTYLNKLSSETSFLQEYSPIWNQKVTTKKIFTIDDLILEFIRFIDPNDSYSSDEVPEYFNQCLDFISNSFSVQQLVDPVLSFDESVKKIILYLYQLATRSKVIKEKKKKSSLEIYFTDAKKEAKKLATQIFSSWVNHSDKLLCERFQQWMDILRKDLSRISINEDNFTEYQEFFSFTGVIDILLMNFILEKQLKSPVASKDWKNNTEEIIKKRRSLWKKKSGLWWEENQLFKSQIYSASVREIWNTAVAIGRIYSYQINDTLSWEELESLAWRIERNSHSLYNPKTSDIILHLDAFQHVREQFVKAIAQNENLIQKLNSKFIDYYLNQIIKKPDKLLINSARKLLINMIQNIENNEAIGIIFCDALRKDFSIKINSHLQKRFQKAKYIVKNFDIQTTSTVNYIPSNTAIGWNSILCYSDTFSYKYSNNDVELVFSDEHGKIANLRTREDREKRLAKILTKSGESVEILPLNPRNIFTELNQYREKVIADKSLFYVPIVWYSKIDDHEKTRDEFFDKIDEYLTEIEEIIYLFHTNGVKYVYILVDHGFTFAKAEDVIEKDNKPKGDLHFRYCLSQQQFTQQEILDKYKDWCIVNPSLYNIKILDNSEKAIKSIITPRGYKTFNKIKIKSKFLHGGLSFQENSINLLTSYCELHPSVKIDVFEPFNHPTYPDSEGESVYELKKIQNFNLFELRIKGLKSLEGEKQKPIKIKLICDNPSIEIVPKGRKILKSGLEIIYQLSFPEKLIISQISVSIVDSQNLLLAKKSFKLQLVLYSAGFDKF